VDPNKKSFNGNCLDHCLEHYYASTEGACLSIYENKYKKSLIECHQSCLECRIGSKSGCTMCNSGKFLNNGACEKECPIGFFANGQVCEMCISPCLTCRGLGNCIDCIPPFFMNLATRNCLLECPNGMYGDEITRTCKVCDSTCAKCNGPTDNDCTGCVLGFNLDNVEKNTGHCVEKACLENTYLSINKDTQTAECLPCDNSCKTCKGLSRNDCIECAKTFFAKQVSSSLVRCISCQEMHPGFFYSIRGVCEGNFKNFIQIIEICGDGESLGLVECDDGNNMDGDGCNSKCLIEPGFKCMRNNGNRDVCFDSPPSISSLVIRKENVVIIKFSKNVFTNLASIFLVLHKFRL